MTATNTVTPDEEEPTPAGSRIAVTAGQFAHLVGVSPNTVTAWLREGLPCERGVGDGRGRGHRVLVDVASGFQWVRARDRAALDAARAEADPEGAKAAKLKAEARLKEMDLAEREGKLVAADDVEATWSQALVTIRENVMAVPGNAVQSGLIPAGRETELEDLCRDALAAVSRAFGAE